VINLKPVQLNQVKLAQIRSQIRFDTSYTAKQTIENVQMYQLGMKLAHLDRANPDSNPDESESYSSRATEILKFINETGIVDQDSFKVRNSSLLIEKNSKKVQLKGRKRSIGKRLIKKKSYEKSLAKIFWMINWKGKIRKIPNNKIIIK